jgi:hypothetical protein
VSTPGRLAATEHRLHEVTSVEELVELVERSPAALYVRFSARLDDDRSVDHQSGLPLPGLSVNPLHPPSWWQGPPLGEWVTRQVRAYHHLRKDDDDRRCWIVTGTIVDRGPDNEPLLADVQAIGVLSDALVDACGRAGSSSPRQEDAPDEDGSPPWQT